MNYSELTEVEYTNLVAELHSYGEFITIDNLKDINWIFGRLSELGYSLSITFITPEMYMEQVRAIGTLPVDSVIQNTLEELQNSKYRGAFTYQLKGNEYKKRGSHGTFMLSTFEVSVIVAYTNVIRLNTKY